MAVSLPEPGPLTKTSTLRIPCSMARRAAASAAICAANGVDLREPLNPTWPDDAHEITLPAGSVIDTIVLLNVLLMCACPCAMFFLSLRRTFLAPARLLGGILSSTPEVIGPNHGLLLAGHGLLLALAGAGVRLGALAMHRQPAPVPQALVAADLDLAPDVRLDLPAQIALDLVVRLDPVPQQDDLVVGHLVDPGVRADAGGPQRLKRPGPADAVDVGEGDLKPLLPREVDADQACHRGQLSFSSGGPAHRPAPVPAGAAPASSRGCPGACAAPGCGTCSAVVAAG